MGCNCAKRTSGVTYVHHRTDGTTKEYTSKVEVMSAVQRRGGYWTTKS